jgi:hypothetical protein
MQWECFQRHGPLFLPGEPGYEKSKVIPPSWQEATNWACLGRMRQELNLPQDLACQPQEGLSGLQPRHSGCTKQPVIHLDNIYRNQNPIESEQMSNRGFQRLMEGVPVPSKSGNRSKSPPYEEKGKKCADYLAWIVQEGGAGLINFLLSAAVKPTDGAGKKLPDVHNVHEWHYRGLC